MLTMTTRSSLQRKRQPLPKSASTSVVFLRGQRMPPAGVPGRGHSCVQGRFLLGGSRTLQMSLAAAKEQTAKRIATIPAAIHQVPQPTTMASTPIRRSTRPVPTAEL